jgi:hypothetical protein
MAAKIPPPSCAATGVGALPHTDPAMACDLSLAAFPEIPYAPLLPARAISEQIVFAEAEHLPGAEIREGRLVVVDPGAHAEAMEQVYLDYIEGNAAPYAPTPATASGLCAIFGRDLSAAKLVKYQLAGPVTVGMQIVDGTKRPVFYNTEYADVLAKVIAMRARSCEDTLREHCCAQSTLIVLNEPYLAALGSSVVPVDPDAAAAAWADVTELMEGALGVHCCANTDWAFLMGLDPAVLSFDAYQFGSEFLLYGEDVARYLEAGGVVAWGIVPSSQEIFAGETVEALFKRLESLRRTACEYMDADLFYRQSLITPTCGIKFATGQEAVAIMGAAAELSRMAREVWG